MNGLNMATYNSPPKGWDHTDILVSRLVLFIDGADLTF